MSSRWFLFQMLYRLPAKREKNNIFKNKSTFTIIIPSEVLLQHYKLSPNGTWIPLSSEVICDDYITTITSRGILYRKSRLELNWKKQNKKKPTTKETKRTYFDRIEDFQLMYVKSDIIGAIKTQHIYLDMALKCEVGRFFWVDIRCQFKVI